MLHWSGISSRLVDAIAVAARQICNIAFNADALTIAMMPVKYGGLDLRLPTDVAIPAFLASTAISNGLGHLMLSTNSYLLWDAKRAHWDSTLSQSQTGLFSVCLTKHLSGQNVILFSPTLTNIAVHAYCRFPPSLAVLGLTRSSRHQPETFLTMTHSASLLHSVCGFHLLTSPVPMWHTNRHTRSASTVLPPWCWPLPRHHALNDVIKRALDTAGFPSILEPTGMS